VSAKVKKRTYNTRLIKQISYRVEEIAVLYDIHTNSVRRWLEIGLRAIDEGRPALIHGSDLMNFLKDRQSKSKHKCQPYEFWCCRCRVPVSAWENLVDIEIRTELLVNLKAVCAVCGAGLNKAGSRKKLPEYQARFDIQTVSEARLCG